MTSYADFRITAVISLSLVMAALSLSAQPAKVPTNTDESKVRSYTLPDPLRMSDGTEINNAPAWIAHRRPEILQLFAANQFGVTPSIDVKPKVEEWEKDVTALGGKARRTQVRLRFGDGENARVIHVVLYLPPDAKSPVPAVEFLGFSPAIVMLNDPGIEEGFGWDAKTKSRVPGKLAPKIGEFDPTIFLDRGIGVAMVYYGDLEPDFKGGDQFGLRSVIGLPSSPRKPSEWGAIGVWAWGASRVLDYLLTNSEINPGQIAIAGASRLGKTTLWTGAQDERFSIVIPMISGEGGAALSRRNYGETVADLTDPKRFEYQFAPAYAQWANRETEMPMDAHMLISLIAPRPLLLITGEKDTWSDPRGEFLALKAAEPVYLLFGKCGLGTDTLPEAGHPILADVGYSMHPSGHEILPADLDIAAQFIVQSIHAPAGEHCLSPLSQQKKRMSAARNFPKDWWPEISKHDAAWYRSDEGLRITANILSWQADNGGWPLMNTTNEPWTGDEKAVGPWGRHGALVASTTNEMRFLARAYRATHDEKDKQALLRAIHLLLDAQYPTGGWPKGYPDFEEPYFRYISLNDDEMVNIMTILKEVAYAPDFNFLDKDIRSKADVAYNRGIDFLMKSQIMLNGTRTAWAQQHDPVTLEPRPARTFEPAAITGNESAGILLMLMSIEHPSPAVQNAIRSGVAWYRSAEIKGIRVVRKDGDQIVVPDEMAPPLWARYYDLKTGKPVFMGRDSIPRDKLADIEKERRAGYAWYGGWGEQVFAAYDAWSKQHPQ
jgi:PelA/Pel-15E family pectate lyase